MTPNYIIKSCSPLKCISLCRLINCHIICNKKFDEIDLVQMKESKTKIVQKLLYNKTYKHLQRSRDADCDKHYWVSLFFDWINASLKEMHFEALMQSYMRRRKCDGFWQKIDGWMQKSEGICLCSSDEKLTFSSANIVVIERRKCALDVCLWCYRAKNADCTFFSKN